MPTRWRFSKKILLIHLVILWLVCVAVAKENHNQTASAEQKSYYRDLYPDTWVATDALGRTMPDINAVGPVKMDKKRVVGIFYVTWHTAKQAKRKNPALYDISEILRKHPEARLDGNHSAWGKEPSYFWGEPEMGYFLSQDEYVIRKDMSMLADAGVDVLVMDVTNAVLYWDEWNVIFSTMEKIKRDGNKVPQFIFWAFNGPVITVVQKLYDRIYKKGEYKDLWFYWDGKPLLLYNANPFYNANQKKIKHPNPHYDPSAKTDKNNPHYGDPDYTKEFYKDYTKEVKNFFTLRNMWWGYYKWNGKRYVGTEDNWSFGYDLGDKRVRRMNPDALVATHKGMKEEAAVTPAQHAHTLIGKSWSRQYGEPELNEYDLPVVAYVPYLKKTVENPEAYGIYFQERWDEALKADPSFIYLNDWNEWTAGKYNVGQLSPDQKIPKFLRYDNQRLFCFMRRPSTYIFIDQYNAEFNRTIQPMKGGYSDNYYMQTVINIRRYKGVRPIPELKGFKQIMIDGDFSDWEQVSVEYRDTRGDVFHRNHLGYGGLHYINNSGRNDIITSKVAVSKKNIFFYVQTDQPLTPYTDKNWMLLLIDADQDVSTGWYGFDYLINEKILDSTKTTLMKYNAKRNQWKEVATLSFRYKKNQMELCVPRELIGCHGNSFGFDFKWSDNPEELKDPISLCLHGDTAPNRRFKYRVSFNEK